MRNNFKILGASLLFISSLMASQAHANTCRITVETTGPVQYIDNTSAGNPTSLRYNYSYPRGLQFKQRFSYKIQNTTNNNIAALTNDKAFYVLSAGGKLSPIMALNATNAIKNDVAIQANHLNSITNAFKLLPNYENSGWKAIWENCYAISTSGDNSNPGNNGNSGNTNTAQCPMNFSATYSSTQVGGQYPHSTHSYTIKAQTNNSSNIIIKNYSGTVGGNYNESTIITRNRIANIMASYWNSWKRDRRISVLPGIDKCNPSNINFTQTQPNTPTNLNCGPVTVTYNINRAGSIYRAVFSAPKQGYSSPGYAVLNLNPPTQTTIESIISANLAAVNSGLRQHINAACSTVTAEQLVKVPVQDPTTPPTVQCHTALSYTTNHGVMTSGRQIRVQLANLTYKIGTNDTVKLSYSMDNDTSVTKQNYAFGRWYWHNNVKIEVERAREIIFDELKQTYQRNHAQFLPQGCSFPVSGTADF